MTPLVCMKQSTASEFVLSKRLVLDFSGPVKLVTIQEEAVEMLQVYKHLAKMLA